MRNSDGRGLGDVRHFRDVAAAAQAPDGSLTITHGSGEVVTLPPAQWDWSFEPDDFGGSISEA